MKSATARTKTVIYDTMLEAAPGNASSRAVVDKVKISKEGQEAIESERDAILDLALMVLAGRVAARPLPLPNHPDLFRGGTLKEFTEIRGAEVGNEKAARVRTIDITVDQWLSRGRAVKRQLGAPRKNEDILDELFDSAVRAGVSGDTTLGQYLGIK